MGFDHREERQQQSEAGVSDYFVAIEIENYTPRLQKVLSHRLGEGVNTGAEYSGNSRFAEEEKEHSVQRVLAEMAADTIDGGDVRWRRVAKRSSTWLDPRRVKYENVDIDILHSLHPAD